MLPNARSALYGCLLAAATLAAMPNGAEAEPPPVAEDGLSARAPTGDGSLSDSQLKEIWSRLQHPGGGAHSQALARKYQDWPIHPFLIEVIEDEGANWNTRVNAMTWLGFHGDLSGDPARAAANDLFRGMIEGYYKEGEFPKTFSRRDWDRLHMAIISLGYVAKTESLDLLKQMVGQEFWDNKGGAPGVLDDGSVTFSSAETAQHMRLIALQGVAMSGQDWAVEMLRTGKGVPSDLLENRDWLLNIAETRRRGVTDEDMESARRKRATGE